LRSTADAAALLEQLMRVYWIAGTAAGELTIARRIAAQDRRRDGVSRQPERTRQLPDPTQVHGHGCRCQSNKEPPVGFVLMNRVMLAISPPPARSDVPA
jgi:hypothetical protein